MPIDKISRSTQMRIQTLVFMVGRMLDASVEESRSVAETLLPRFFPVENTPKRWFDDNDEEIEWMWNLLKDISDRSYTENGEEIVCIHPEGLGKKELN